MKILVVDDEPMLRELLEEEFTYRGHQVVGAGSADQAWQFLEKQEFDVVFSDIRMPYRSGVDLLKQIRDRFPAETLRVYLLSGFSDITPEDAIQLGANGMFSKPYSINQLLSIIEKG